MENIIQVDDINQVDASVEAEKQKTRLSSIFFFFLKRDLVLRTHTGDLSFFHVFLPIQLFCCPTPKIFDIYQNLKNKNPS